jgi:hypothetical protein
VHTSLPAEPQRRPAGCTLAQYAEAKRLSIDLLWALGLEDIHLRGAPAVRIPYMNANGEEIAVRHRTALFRSEQGPDGRFRWRKGSRPALYGLWALESARKAGRVVLVEGESCAHTLIAAGITVLGIPGAGTWKEEWGDALEGIGVIFVVVEPDAGGERTLSWVERSRLRERVRLVFMEDAKDVSDLHVADPSRFPERFGALLRDAPGWPERAAAQTAAADRAAWASCRQLAERTDILGQAVHTVRRLGLVGEDRAVKLLVLVIVSRLHDRPVSAVVTGPSAVGKSFTVGRVLQLFSSEAVYFFSGMSEKHLAFGDEPLAHRILVFYENEGIRGDFATYLVRSLLSEGRLCYGTVEKGPDGLRPRTIEREGPTGLITTTTRVALHPENETRVLAIPMSDTPEQTHLVMRAAAEERETETEAVVGPWHALDAWLAAGERRVTIPFATALADAIPPVAVRLRRDFVTLLALIRAHALLHRATRDRDAQGRVVASPADYAAVRALVHDVLAEGVEVTVSPSVRATVEAVDRLVGSDERHTSVRKVAEALGLDHSAANRRVHAAMQRGFLVDEGPGGRGRALRIALGAELPADRPVLPTADVVSRDVQLGTAPEGLGTPLPAGGDPLGDDDLARWEELAEKRS